MPPSTITWPIIAGKFYTLLYSPDMSENSWLTLQQAAATSDGTRTAYFPVSSPDDKMFWRIKIEDIDSDGDGLTDAEEAKLGTGYRSGVPDPTWDYWGLGGVTGWSAVNRSNIEFQNIIPEESGNQCVELKAYPAGHYGIKQDVGTHKGATYVLTLDCRNGSDLTPASSNFNVLVDGEIECKISFTDSTETDPLVQFVPTGEWTTVDVPFTATKPITSISLVPVNSLNDSTSSLIANMKAARVDIVPDDNMAGVIGDMVRSVNPSTVIKHFVTPKKADDFVILKATGIKPNQITPNNANQLFEWDNSVGEAVPGDWTKWRVRRDDVDRYPVKIKNKKDHSVASQLIVWVVWSDVTTTKGVATYSPLPGGSIYEISTEPAEGWKFVFTIKPASILDSTTLERPNLSGLKRKPPPGADKEYTIVPSKGAGDSATNKWDVSRQYKLTIRNPGSIPKADLQAGNVPAAWIANQHTEVDTPVSFPASDVEGNDDPFSPLYYDEDDDPYKAFTTSPKLNHNIGELSSCDVVVLRVLDAWGAANRTYSVEMKLLKPCQPRMPYIFIRIRMEIPKSNWR